MSECVGVVSLPSEAKPNVLYTQGCCKVDMAPARDNTIHGAGLTVGADLSRPSPIYRPESHEILADKSAMGAINRPLLSILLRELYCPLRVPCRPCNSPVYIVHWVLLPTAATQHQHTHSCSFQGFTVPGRGGR